MGRMTGLNELPRSVDVLIVRGGATRECLVQNGVLRRIAPACILAEAYAAAQP